jgi:polyisoprenoid-binding protein YceI
MLKPLAISLILLAGAGTVHAAPKAYTIDATHTQVHATYSHLGFSNIAIRFNTVEGQFMFDAAKPANSSLNIKVPISSLDTGVQKFDEHLWGADFFDAAKFPEATFKSTKVTEVSKGKLKLLGNLTIHGVTKPVEFNVSVNNIGMHPMRKTAAAGFDATAKIKRSDFGLGAYVPNVGDDVTLQITMEALEAKK